jgi:hypothetical protein
LQRHTLAPHLLRPTPSFSISLPSISTSVSISIAFLFLIVLLFDSCLILSYFLPVHLKTSGYIELTSELSGMAPSFHYSFTILAAISLSSCLALPAAPLVERANNTTNNVEVTPVNNADHPPADINAITGSSWLATDEICRLDINDPQNWKTSGSAAFLEDFLKKNGQGRLLLVMKKAAYLQKQRTGSPTWTSKRLEDRLHPRKYATI